MSSTEARERVEWEIPAGQPDWLFGTGATRSERSLVWLTVLAGLAAVVAVARVTGSDWAWWQWALVVVLVLDVVGGVAANSLGSAKRLYAQEPASADPLRRRFALNHVLFAAAHVHLFVVVAAFDLGRWTWAAYWYAVCVVGVAMVRACPVYLQRPVSAGALTAALVVGSVIEGPVGLTWLGPVLMVKLAVAHSVTEAPFRPAS